MDVAPLRRQGRWRMRAAVLAILVLVCGLRASTPTFRDSASPVSLPGQARTEPLPAGDAPAFLAVFVQLLFGHARDEYFRRLQQLSKAFAIASAHRLAAKCL